MRKLIIKLPANRDFIKRNESSSFNNEEDDGAIFIFISLGVKSGAMILLLGLK